MAEEQTECAVMSFLVFWWPCCADNGMSINMLVADEASGWQITLTWSKINDGCWSPPFDRLG